MVSFAAATFSMLDWKEKATKRIMKVQNNRSGGEWDRLVIQAVIVTRTIVDVSKALSTLLLAAFGGKQAY
ncbi:hypothetical protein CFC21_097446 [Triticum aestivum]|uniref:Uncharacterized protein n=4 Tax=Triticum TaxID=4564 RepID=A0A9R0ZB99_TRITD|nr:hypothetical protein TRIUR3_14973 [Triticum urartu]KAF7095228.1 hypothetical protein CFC21_097446 [Triticum aestivum]VAI73766.1 unnamed protein product [Triticum turgidum subsp. durum]